MLSPAGSTTGISPAEFWAETTCTNCGERIARGEPRCVVAFLELGIGPGSPDYNYKAVQEDIEYSEAADGCEKTFGLLTQEALTLCDVCSGEGAYIPNPWFVEREARAADDTGGSVRAIPVSQMGVSTEEVTADEEQDAILAGFATPTKMRIGKQRRTRTDLTENDYRDRMARFLRANPQAMHGKMLQVCTLWAQGKKQTEIERETHIDQSTVCRLVRSGKAMLA